MRWRPLVLGALLVLPGIVAAAQSPPTGSVRLEASDERPVIGQSVRLTVLAGGTPLPGARVTATYRPNSSTTSTEELVATDAAGSVLWEPRAAGPVNLQAWAPGDVAAAPAVTFAVAVRYGRFPPSGLAIMLIAGALLFGGAALGMARLLRSGAALPEDEPPST
ncbi:MAG TPA: hypothetical protein VM617_01730 [Thermoanaerobaculia bacterium]|nr:hypothetical protein [Thermoanaerobaculia bacterium]